MTPSAVIVCIASLLVTTLSCSSDPSGPGPQPLVPAAVTGQGVPAGTLTQATIGPAGGQLTSSDGGLALIVPAGALASATVIGIQPYTNLAPGGSGNAYQLTPEGTTFTAPVQLTFHFTDEDLAGSALAALRVAYQDAQGHWLALKAITRDLANHELRVSTTHFSTWAAVTGLKLNPSSATVEPGATVSLQVEDCQLETVASADPLVHLLPVCRPLTVYPTWRANNVVNGNAANGTLQRVANNEATYSAPSVAPSTNPVQVQAEVNSINYPPTGPTQYGTTLLFSYITVSDHPAWTGTVSSLTQLGIAGVSTTTITTSASITWIWSIADETYLPQGTVVYALDQTGFTYSPPCHSTQRASGAVLATDGALTIFGNSFHGGGTNTTLPITSTSDCNDLRVVETTVAAGGPIAWWPPTIGTLSANGKSMAGTTTNGAFSWTWSFSRP